MPGSDELDRVIDGALAGYSAVEPLAGLEERVLNRVRVAARRKQLTWAFAFVAVTAVVVAVIAVRIPRQPASKGNDITRVITPAPVPAVEKARAVPKRLVRSRAPRPGLLPKLEQFPSPTPMTAEERALVEFVGQRPAEAQQVFAALRKQGDDPIEIEPIQIPPLHKDGAQ